MMDSGRTKDHKAGAEKEKAGTAKKKSVVDRVADGIVSGIIDGQYGPGSKLPTETELCRAFDAGRNSVREAVKKLEANGVVYIKRADGTFVSETYNQKLLDPMLYQVILQKNSWKDFVQLRSVIEIGTLQIILLEEPDQKKFKQLEEILAKMCAEIKTKTPDVEKMMQLDAGFHSLIAGLANNPQLVTITDYITRLTIPSRKKTIQEVIENGETEHFIELHRQLLDVIKNRKKEAVVKTVLDHYVYWR